MKNTESHPVSVRHTRSALLLAVTILIAIFVGNVRADDAYWSAGGNPDPSWNNPANWLSGIVPGNPLPFTNYNTSEGSVIFNTDTGFYDSFVPVPWTIGRLVISNGSGNYILHGSDLTLAQAQSANNTYSVDISGAPAQLITISNNLIFPVATNNPATNVRHQFGVANAATINIYGDIVKTGNGYDQITFRGGNAGGTFNLYGRVLWDTNIVSRTDPGNTVAFYNSGNTWTQMNNSVGTVLLGVDNALPVNSLFNFNQNSAGNSFLRMSNYNQTLLALSTTTVGTGGNTQTVDTAISSTLTLNDPGTNIFGGFIVGGGRVLKMGSGMLTFVTNNSTWTGGLLINAGVVSLGDGTGPGGGGIVTAITNNGTLIVNKADATTLPNPISGTGQLIKLAGGTLTLPAVNTYSGSTLLSNGTTVVSGQLAGAGAVNVYAGATLMGNGGIAGPATVNTNGQIQTTTAPNPGTLTFSNNLTMNPGGFATYKFGGPTTIGSGVNDLFDVRGNLTLSTNPLVLVPVGPLTVGNTYVVATAGGTLSGTFGAVTNPTRYTFTTSSVGNQARLTVGGGAPASVLWAGTNVNWDLATSNWTNGANRDKYFHADAVTFNDTSSTNFAVTLTAAMYPGSVTFNNTNNNFTLAGAGKLSGATGVTKNGAATTTLNNANDFTGPVFVNAGTLRVANSSALGVTNGGTFVTNGATLELNGISLFNPGELITISGTGLNNTGAVINSTADQNNSIRYLSLATNASIGQWTNRWDVRGPFGNGSFSGGLFLNGYTLTKLGTNKISLADVIATNAGSIQLAGGVFGLTRSQVDGPGVINVGTSVLQFENNSAGYVAKPIVVNGGTIQLVGNTFTVASPVTNSGVTFDVANGLTFTFTNIITGTGAVTKISPGTLFLQAPDLCSGPTTIAVGTLQLDAGSGLPNTPSILVSNNATLNVQNIPGGLLMHSGEKLSGAGTVQGDISVVPGTTVSPGSSAGTLTLGGNATFDTSTINFELGANPALFDLGNDLILVNGGLTLNNVTTLNLIPTATLSTASPYTLFTYGFLNSGTTANLNILNDSRYNFSLLDFASTTPYIQVQVTGNANSLFWRGGDLSNPTLWDLKNTSNWWNGVSLDKFFSGDTITFDDTAVTSTVTLAGSLSPASLTMLNNATDYTFTGAGNLGGGSLIKQGSRRLTIANTAPNNFTSLDVQSGAVVMMDAAGNSFPFGLTVNGGTLGFGGATFALFGGNAVVNSGLLIFSNTVPNNFSATLSLNGGSAQFVNTSANSFNPGFEINAGSITLANSGANALGTSTVSDTLNFNQPVDATASGILIGSGTVVKQGNNTVTLSGNNAGFTGLMQVNSGTLRSAATGAFGGGTVAVQNGAALELNGQNATSVTTVTLQSAGPTGLGGIINSGADQQNAFRNVALTGNGAFGGSGRWDIRGAANNGTFPGVLDLGGFTLTKFGTNKISLVDLTFYNDGTVIISNGFFGITRSIIGGTGPIIIGTNMVQFENNTAVAAVMTKPFVTDRSTIQVVGNSWGIYSPITNLGGVKFDIASGLTFTNNNLISGPGTLAKPVSTGTLFLTTNNTFTGSVIHNAGQIQLGTALALGSSKTLFATNTTGTTGGTGNTIDLVSNVVVTPTLTLLASTTNSPDIRTSLRAVAGVSEWQGPITLAGDGRFGMYADVAGSALTVSGNITGPNAGANTIIFIRGANGTGLITGTLNFPGQLLKTDAGSWQVNSSGNVYSMTTVAVSTLRAGVDNAFCPTSPLTMGQANVNNCTLDLNGHNQTFSAIFDIGTGVHRIGNDSKLADSVFTFAGTNVSTYPGQFVDNITTNGNRKLALTVTSGTLYLNGINSNTGPTTVQGGTLGGNGSLASAVTVQSGTLSAGNSIGRLTISNDLTFLANGTNLAEVTMTGSVTNDVVNVISNLTYAGTLVVTNIGTQPYTNGATFKLFNAASYSGSFSTIVPANPAPGFGWITTNLPINGTLSVVATVSTTRPIINFSSAGNTLQLSWPPDHLGWRLQGQTNASPNGYVSNWFDVPGSTSTTNVTLTINPTNGSVFYRLLYP